MPLILPKKAEKAWLNLTQNESQLKSFLVPYSSQDMRAYPVVNSLNKLGNNTTDRTIIELFEYPDLPELE
jgi:putative SOS response-associated peptidase YedK